MDDWLRAAFFWSVIVTLSLILLVITSPFLGWIVEMMIYTYQDPHHAVFWIAGMPIALAPLVAIWLIFRPVKELVKAVVILVGSVVLLYGAGLLWCAYLVLHDHVAFP